VKLETHVVASIYLRKIVFPDVDPPETLAKCSTAEWKSLREWVIGVWDLYRGKRGNGISEALKPAASEVSQVVGDGGLVEVGREWNIHGSMRMDGTQRGLRAGKRFDQRMGVNNAGYCQRVCSIP